MGYTLIANGVRNWASIIDGNTVAQAARTNAVPVMAGPLALMPDAHVGMAPPSDRSSPPTPPSSPPPSVSTSAAA